MLRDPGITTARRCSCRTLHRLVDLKERVRIPPRYQDCTLDSFTPSNFSQVRALSEARRFADKYPDVERGLMFAGGTGLGKTHLAVGIVREVLQRFRHDVLFVDFPDLLAMHNALARAESRLDVDWNRICRVTLLVLDNFGLVSPTDENVYLAERLLRARSEARRITIYTGERLSLRELLRRGAGVKLSGTHRFLSALSPELVLRLMADSRLVSIVGKDYRENARQSGAELFS
jgi:DNA replication protein DnaC